MNITYSNGTTTTLDADRHGTSPDPDDNGARVSLIGFSVTTVPDVSGYPESYREPSMYLAHKLDPANLPDLTGYYAQYVGNDGGMFGWPVPVASVTA